MNDTRSRARLVAAATVLSVVAGCALLADADRSKVRDVGGTASGGAGGTAGTADDAASDSGVGGTAADAGMEDAQGGGWTGNAILGTAKGTSSRLYALDLGGVQAQHVTSTAVDGGTAYSQALVSAGRLYLYGTGSVSVYELGKWNAPVLQWHVDESQFAMGVGLCGGRLWLLGSVFGVPEGPSVLTAFDASSGKPIAGSSKVFPTLAVSMESVGGTLIVATGSTLTGIDCATGATLQSWSIPADSGVPDYASLVLARDTDGKKLWVGATSWAALTSVVYRLDPTQNSLEGPVFTLATPGITGLAPASGGYIGVSVEAGGGQSMHAGGSAWCVRLSDGASKEAIWPNAGDGGPITRPILFGGDVFALRRPSSFYLHGTRLVRWRLDDSCNGLQEITIDDDGDPAFLVPN